LARWQAEWVAAELGKLGVEVEMVPITTQGDVSTRPLGAIGGQGLFTKEIQRALLDRAGDVAVHSLKDLPTEPVPGLRLAAVPERESTRDVLVSNLADSIEALPPGARVGTGSTRRRAQLLHARPDLRVLDIRGNVDTRLRKLDEGLYDAIILAEAGLRRLGFQQRIQQVIPRDMMLHAVGQGALGIEARADDPQTLEILAHLDHAETHAAVLAERAMLATLRGGCLAPVGAWGRIEEGRLLLDGVVLSNDGSRRVHASAAGALEDAELVGQEVARRLLADGAAGLIETARKTIG
jgi:hydroxymethylbilane synthase